MSGIPLRWPPGTSRSPRRCDRGTPEAWHLGAPEPTARAKIPSLNRLRLDWLPLEMALSPDRDDWKRADLGPHSGPKFPSWTDFDWNGSHLKIDFGADRKRWQPGESAQERIGSK